jgi:hypothetical protein
LIFPELVCKLCWPRVHTAINIPLQRMKHGIACFLVGLWNSFCAKLRGRRKKESKLALYSFVRKKTKHSCTLPFTVGAGQRLPTLNSPLSWREYQEIWDPECSIRTFWTPRSPFLNTLVTSNMSNPS